MVEKVTECQVLDGVKVAVCWGPCCSHSVRAWGRRADLATHAQLPSEGQLFRFSRFQCFSF